MPDDKMNDRMPRSKAQERDDEQRESHGVGTLPASPGRGRSPRGSDVEREKLGRADTEREGTPTNRALDGEPDPRARDRSPDDVDADMVADDEQLDERER
jgi:hypothetical protein